MGEYGCCSTSVKGRGKCPLVFCVSCKKNKDRCKSFLYEEMEAKFFLVQGYVVFYYYGLPLEGSGCISGQMRRTRAGCIWVHDQVVFRKSGRG